MFLSQISKENTEYQIYIGYKDSHSFEEDVSIDELRDMLAQFFRRKEMDFSMYTAKGGYLYADGTFDTEDTLCINIIGSSDMDIIRLAKNLSMFMNQECSLVIKELVKSDFC